MTSESFAADMGNMLGDGADLAPLMGTFSFSGRDPNLYEPREEERKFLRGVEGHSKSSTFVEETTDPRSTQADSNNDQSSSFTGASTGLSADNALSS